MASGDTLAVFIPQANEPPSSNPATFDSRNRILVLDFDTTTSESAIFRGVLPANYAGGGLTLDIYWMATSATTGDVVWGGSIERAQSGGTDQDSDSFATEQLSTEPFRLKIARKPADAGDTMTGDAEFTEAHLKET